MQTCHPVQNLSTGSQVRTDLSQVKLPLIKTTDNRTSFTNTMNEIKIVKISIYNKIMLRYKMSQIGRRSNAILHVEFTVPQTKIQNS